MLVIHIISTEDTRLFSNIYQNLDATILINPSSREARKAIINEMDTILFIGHGTEYGLLNSRLDGYFIDSEWVNLLREKNIIGIWCYAGNFAERYDLKGFFTSNFISNIDELIDNGFERFDNVESVIQDENTLFANKINNFLLTSRTIHEWVDELQHSASAIPFVQYNYEALLCNI
jgi:hypothetical protein